MSARPACEEARALAPELALGIAAEDERARALSHFAGCGDCRRDVHALSDAADELLLLAPPREPPPGFEARVVDRIAADQVDARPGRRRPPRRRRARWFLAPAAALAVAAAAAFAVLTATEGDRELGKLYRQSLAVADGKAFGALPLHGRDRRRAGTVFGYEGRPSWLFVVVRRPGADGRFDVEVETRRGRRQSLGSLRVKRGRGSFGKILPVRLFDVARVRVTGGGAAFTAVAPPPPD